MALEDPLKVLLLSEVSTSLFGAIAFTTCVFTSYLILAVVLAIGVV